MDDRTLTYEGYEPQDEGLREALCTLGNGVLASRGAAPECRADGVHYPGTYRAGLFNRLTDDVDGAEVTNESMVNLPNWLVLSFRVDDGPWFLPSEAELVECRLALDLRRGVLTRHLCAEIAPGKRLVVTQRWIVHMVEPQLAALETTFGAQGFSGTLTVRSAIDTSVRNTGVARYRALSDLHLEIIAQEEIDEQCVGVNQSHVRIAEVARTRVIGSDAADGGSGRRQWFEEDGLVGHEFDLDHGREGRGDRRRR